jgi:hypothetical protein
MSSFVQKLGIDQPEAPKFYGIEPQQTGRAIMLELRTRDGKRTAYAYSYLTEAIYEPETGIVINVSDVQIIIKGRCLEDVYFYLLANRLNYVQEDYSGIDSGGKDAFIEAIVITAKTISDTL